MPLSGSSPAASSLSLAISSGRALASSGEAFLASALQVLQGQVAFALVAQLLDEPHVFLDRGVLGRRPARRRAGRPPTGKEVHVSWMQAPGDGEGQEERRSAAIRAPRKRAGRTGDARTYHAEVKTGGGQETFLSMETARGVVKPICGWVVRAAGLCFLGERGMPPEVGNRVAPPSSPLVPKLCLGTLAARASASSPVEGPDAKRSFADARSQAELGNEGSIGCSRRGPLFSWRAARPKKRPRPARRGRV